MRIMVVGGGGREHAIIKKLKENPAASEIFALPGNGGIARDAVCVPIAAKDIDGIVDFAVKEKIDYAVIAPDDPLVLGAADALTAAHIPVFGPSAAAAQIEGSKIFAKNLMRRYGIPTARYEVFTDEAAALDYVRSAPMPTVIKADGLALGKGVVIAETPEEAERAVRSMMEERVFGDSGTRIVVEEFLTGPEVSVLALCDGTTVLPLVSSMDHKRAGDGDSGLNTGGMGTVAPNPFYTPDIAARCMEEIFLPTVRAMKAENREFRGCLYFGLMLTDNGPKVIEYNCRFGDPETQVVLPLLRSDLLEAMLAVTNGRLAEYRAELDYGAACCVILASAGYPVKYEKGFEITLPPEGADCEYYFAGARLENGRLLSDGGRVLGVTARRGTLVEAIDAAYAGVRLVRMDKSFYRNDIGARALAKLSEKED